MWKICQRFYYNLFNFFRAILSRDTPRKYFAKDLHGIPCSKNVLHFSWWFARVYLHFNISIFPCKWYYDRGNASSRRERYGGDKNLSVPLHPLRNPYSSRMYYLSRRFSLARETVANIYRYRFVAFTFDEGKGNIVAQWCFVTVATVPRTPFSFSIFNTGLVLFVISSFRSLERSETAFIWLLR